MSSSNSDHSAKSPSRECLSSNPNGTNAVTQCRLLTGVGRSAIAVIELIGAEAARCLDDHFHAASGRPFTGRQLTGNGRQPVGGQIRYGRWGDEETGESIVVTPMRNDHFEIQCHGGIAAIERIIHDMVASGAVRGDTTFRDVASDHDDRRSRWIVDAKEILCRCTTAKTAAIAMDQVRGAFADWADAIEGVKPDAAMSPEMQRETIAQIKAMSVWSMRLDRPFDVVLVGPPNVGKSSLINAMVGYERSIVLDQPGTTRDVLVAETVIDGWPIRFRDTAGLRDTDEAIEKEGIVRAKSSAAEADLVLRISTPEMAAPSDNAWPKSLSILNKLDLADSTAAEGYDVGTIATTGQGIDPLQRLLVERLVPDPLVAGMPVILTPEQRDWVESRLSD